ncbi:adenosylcobinamide-GDP ribazoletransferase [Sporosarcina sp. 179-K 3D1 HS]|uniref:adenosylcobinamide-GDP ribazoletransferase n=1 Tax=Sporosarcina sp. 179-K 3D1 HS TaxID=3232169 RepID=UPI00399F4FB2
MNGILLAIQFFTAIPLQKEFPLGRKEVTSMYIALPFVGAAIGFGMFAVAELFSEGMGLGTLLTAVAVVTTGIVLTGGLHLDGWADTGDAYFSYRDQAKRHEIMDDPRLGAFGTMALVLLVLVKVALLHEFLSSDAGWSYLYFLLIPFLARAGMNIFFVAVPLAKDKGIAHFFKEKMAGKGIIGVSIVASLLLLAIIGFMTNQIGMAASLAAVLSGALLLFRKWTIKNFGGVSGDLCGAFIEGAEVLLWFVVIVFI